jgi:carbonic anhydrase/acetyltransferase-like protein (isoleucine patch superfamily)
MASSLRPFDGVSPHCGERVYIDPTAVVIGNVSLADDVSIWPTAVIRGDVNTITIGACSNIQDGSVLHVNHANQQNPTGDALVIGEDVTVGHRVVLHGCTIADQCLIGINSVVMDKAFVETQVLIGANSLVPPGKILDSGYLYVGSPVKKIRPLTKEEKAYFKYSAQHYTALKDKYLTGLTQNATQRAIPR